MDFEKIVEYAFRIVLSILGFFAVSTFVQFNKGMDNISSKLEIISREMTEFNVKMAVTVEKVESHEKRISRMEQGN